MKKILLSAAAIAALGTSGAHADTGNVGGFYAGLAAGVAGNFLQISNMPEQDTFIPKKLGASSAIFELYTGYGKLWGNFYAGLEGNFGLNTLNTKNNLSGTVNNPVNLTQKAPWYGGVTLRLGRSVFASQGLVYVGAGVQFVGNQITMVGYGVNSFSSKKKSFVTSHFSPSVGIEGMITERMTMRLQVNYNVSSGKKKYTPLTYIGTDPVNTQFRPSSVVAKIGIGYKF